MNYIENIIYICVSLLQRKIYLKLRRLSMDTIKKFVIKHEIIRGGCTVTSQRCAN